LKFECGGACAASTAGDYLRFAQMLLNGGRIGNTRLLSRKSVEYMTTDQLGPEIRDVNPLGSEPDDAGFGFGLGVAVRRHNGSGTTPGSEGEYSWTGAYGTQFWVDPKEQLVVVFMLAARGPAVTRYRQLIRALVLQAIDD
jgi:CubicO group peptidase (beta-lactamase class C family)